MNIVTERVPLLGLRIISTEVFLSSMYFWKGEAPRKSGPSISKVQLPSGRTMSKSPSTGTCSLHVTSCSSLSAVTVICSHPSNEGEYRLLALFTLTIPDIATPGLATIMTSSIPSDTVNLSPATKEATIPSTVASTTASSGRDMLNSLDSLVTAVVLKPSQLNSTVTPDPMSLFSSGSNSAETFSS